MRKRVVVTGRVQGVFFRDSIRRLALEEDVRGWVRNRADGALEAVLEGEPASVERVVEFVRRGPPQARVMDVEALDEPEEGLQDFRVK